MLPCQQIDKNRIVDVQFLPILKRITLLTNFIEKNILTFRLSIQIIPDLIEKYLLIKMIIVNKLRINYGFHFLKSKTYFIKNSLL